MQQEALYGEKFENGAEIGIFIQYNDILMIKYLSHLALLNFTYIT